MAGNAMSWRARLQERRGAIFHKVPGDPLTKLTKPKKRQFDSLTELTKPSCVGFVSDPSGRFANIEDATTLAAPALKAERARLLALAAGQWRWIEPAHIHRMPDADLAEWLGLNDGQRVAFLHLLADTAERHAGRIPEADTAAMHCHHCGPVWVHPSIATALPKVGGWARALGCPWCFVRKAGGYIPRPSIACGDCQHFTPDTINPPAGMGTCTSGHGMHYPMTAHRCAEHLISAEIGDLAL
jgi:hypothetical protein